MNYPHSLWARVACSMIIAISFAQAIGMTAVGFVMEKKSGLLDRIWAAGGPRARCSRTGAQTRFGARCNAM